MSEAWPNPDPEIPPLYPEWEESPPDPFISPPDAEFTETPDPVSVTGVIEPWPLRAGDFFSPPETAPQAHTGDNPQDMAWITLIQEQVGATLTGIYDVETASAVRAWRVNHGHEDEDYVDQEAWEAMMRFEKDADVTVGLQ